MKYFCVTSHMYNFKGYRHNLNFNFWNITYFHMFSFAKVLHFGSSIFLDFRLSSEVLTAIIVRYSSLLPSFSQKQKKFYTHEVRALVRHKFGPNSGHFFGALSTPPPPLSYLNKIAYRSDESRYGLHIGKKVCQIHFMRDCKNNKEE